MKEYTIYNHKNEIIAVSTYAGKVVRGVAKCNPNDEYDFAKGKELAIARLDAKVASKRKKNAMKKYNEAAAALNEAKKHFDKMSSYLTDSSIQETEASAKLEDILNSL